MTQIFRELEPVDVAFHLYTNVHRLYLAKRDRVLCQHCVRYSLKPRANTVIYGDTPMNIVVAGNR